MRTNAVTIGRLLLITAATLVSSKTALASDRPSMWGLEMVGRNYAFEKGYTGAGVMVGVMDEAARGTHQQFADRWMGGFNVDGSPYGPIAAHGTHVSGTIAGVNVGVAPGSLIYGINWSALNGDTGYANGYRWGLEQGIRLFNNSWGLNFIDPDTGIRRSITVHDMSKSRFERDLAHTFSALEASVAAGSIQVFATGNDKLIQPSILASLPYYYPEMQPHWLAVTAVGPMGVLASYANMCGVAADWCITAPGGDGAGDDAIWSAGPNSDDYYVSMSGTSMATPHVTGAMAVAAQVFPDAPYSQLTQLLLQTATDLGAPGVDSIYGWGLLNIGNVVDTINPGTAGTLANATWARFTTLGHISNILRQRLTAPSVANYSDSSAFQLLGYAHANHTDTRGSLTISGTAKPDIWVAPVYGTASIASSHTSFSATSTLGGLVIGADILNGDEARFGLALGYSNTSLESDEVADRGNANAFHLGAYGGWEDNNWFVNRTGQVAIFNQSIERHAIAGATGVSFDPVGRSRFHQPALTYPCKPDISSMYQGAIRYLPTSRSARAGRAPARQVKQMPVYSVSPYLPRPTGSSRQVPVCVSNRHQCKSTKQHFVWRAIFPMRAWAATPTTPHQPSCLGDQSKGAAQSLDTISYAWGLSSTSRPVKGTTGSPSIEAHFNSGLRLIR